MDERAPAATPPDWLSVPDITRALHPYARRAGKTPPRYTSVVGRVRDGLVEAEFDGKQYWVHASQIPAVAALFGLIEQPSTSRSRRHRAA